MAWIWTGPSGDRATQSQADSEAKLFSVADMLESRFSPAEALTGKLYLCLQVEDIDLRLKLFDRIIASIGQHQWDLHPQSRDLTDMVEAMTCWCEAPMNKHRKDVLEYAQQIGVRGSKAYTIFSYVSSFRL